MVGGRAIELSLQESAAPQTQPPKHEVIELDDDEDNDPIDEEERRFRAEMELAMKMSTQDSVPIASSSTPTSAPAPAPPSRLAGIGALTPAERKKMEEERLARLKRTRPDLQRAASTIDLDDSDEEDAEAEMDVDVDEAERARGAKRQHISRPSDPRARRANTHASAPSRSAASTSRNTAGAGRQGAAAAARSAAGKAGAGPSAQTGLFWDGELRQTGNQLVDPRESAQPDFRLTDIISPVSFVLYARDGVLRSDHPTGGGRTKKSSSR